MNRVPPAGLQSLDRLVGRWTTEATHPAVPGVVVHGTVSVEWLEGEQFLIHRARTDHPDFPDSISIIGNTTRGRVEETPSDELTMHYFDSRGVFRVYQASFDETEWRLWRDDPGFSQRFSGRFAADGTTIAGTWQISKDDVHWEDDLRITYRRE